MAKVLSDTFPSSGVIVYSWKGLGAGTVVHTAAGPYSRKWEDIKGHEIIRRVIQYDPDVRDPRANEPVTIAEACAGDTKAEELFLEEVFHPNGLRFQLRSVLYDGPTFAGYIALGHTADKGEFLDRHKDIVRLVTPQLVDGLGAMRAVGSHLVDAESTARLLDKFSQPAFLVDESGGWSFANKAARAAFHHQPPWFNLLRGDDEDRLSACANVQRLDLGGKLWRLVLPRDGAVPTTPREVRRQRIERFPKHLQQTAHALSDGRSDKEIATDLDVSLSTARSYVSQVFRRLEIHRRRDLVGLFAEGARC